MKQQATLGGRSMVFNVAFVVLNILGLALLTMGGHTHFAESPWMFWTGLSLVLITSGGIFLFRGRWMMSSVARVIVGGLFIVSGLIKANDPLGFSYKLEDYFQDGALAYRIKELFGTPGFSMEWLVDQALVLSVMICVMEMVLGVLVLIGGKIKFVSYTLLLMMLFFTFLTWHTDNCHSEHRYIDRDTYEITDPIVATKLEQAKHSDEIAVVSKTSKEIVLDESKRVECVTDCGCFGDAMKGSVGRSLTPNESLWKDIVLLYLVLWIFISQWIIRPNNLRQNIVFIILGMTVVGFFSWVFGWLFPVFFAFTAIVVALWVRRAGGTLFGNHFGSALSTTALSSALVIYVLLYAPIKDYRPYAVGENLSEITDEGIPKNEFEPFIVHSDLSDWELSLGFIRALHDSTSVSDSIIRVWSVREETLIDVPIAEFTDETKGYLSPDFEVRDTVLNVRPGNSYIQVRDAILGLDKVVILVSESLKEGVWSMKKLKKLKSVCKTREVPFIMVCSATRKEMDAFRNEHNFPIPTFSMDEIELKIISRSNPALMYLEKAVVKAKYPHRSIPDAEDFETECLKK